LSPSFRPPGAPAGTSYLAYLYPGILALVLLFTAIFATISTVEDRHSGFLQGVLVAPVSRTAIVVGQALGGTTLAVGQGLAFLALAPLAGLRVAPLGVLGALARRGDRVRGRGVRGGGRDGAAGVGGGVGHENPWRTRRSVDVPAPAGEPLDLDRDTRDHSVVGRRVGEADGDSKQQLEVPA